MFFVLGITPFPANITLEMLLKLSVLTFLVLAPINFCLGLYCFICGNDPIANRMKLYALGIVGIFTGFGIGGLFPLRAEEHAGRAIREPVTLQKRIERVAPLDSEGEQLGDLCGVCNLDLRTRQQTLTTPCCTVLCHFACLSEWVKVKGACPRCRTALRFSRGKVQEK